MLPLISQGTRHSGIHAAFSKDEALLPNPGCRMGRVRAFGDEARLPNSGRLLEIDLDGGRELAVLTAVAELAGPDFL
jgi:hypothetical protein